MKSGMGRNNDPDPEPEEINFYTTRDEYGWNEYGWMSNFWRAGQIVDGIEYPTNEHFYQSQKAIWPTDAEEIRRAARPWTAMRMGRLLKMIRPNWERVKVEVMFKGLRAKFGQNLDLKEKLLATGDAVIHENSPSDLFWGKKGQDMLGKLLMRVREELRGVYDG